MRRFTLPLLAASFFAAPLLAQTPAVALAAPASQGCPVGLDARHAQDGGLLATDRNTRSKDQAYRLSFLPGDARGIVQAQVRLHGIVGPTILPARTRPEEGTATEQLTLRPTRIASHRFVSVLYTQKLTGVQWIEVERLRYADGTTWKASPTSLCSVAPSGFTLVAAGK